MAPSAAENTCDWSDLYEETEETGGAKAFLLKTAPFDARFPNTNQTKHCWQAYVDYFKCINTKGEDFKPCKQFSRVYHSLCPTDWTDRWDDQRDRGAFPSSLNGAEGVTVATVESDEGKRDRL